MSRIRKELEIEITLRAIFEAPTLVELAHRVEEAGRQSQKAKEIAPILTAAAPRASGLPLSYSQARIWFMHQLAPESGAYNVAAPIRFTGVLHKEALKRSLDEVVRRHESLRTTFRNSEGEPIQIVTPDLRLEMPEIDLRRLPEEVRLEEAKRVLREEAGRPFDLEQGPLIRVILLQLDEEDHVLLLNMHHVISDQWSLGVIAREITSLYNAFCSALPTSMELLPVQYADFAVSQGKYLTGERWETQLSYWKKQLSNLQPFELPTDHPRPSVQTFHGAHHSLSLSKDLVERLKKLSAQENASLYMAFLAAFKTLLLRYSGQEDIAIGSPVANRDRLEWEGIIGTFINILVLRTDLSGNPTFREVLQRVREVALEAFAHQEMPFEKLVEELQPDRDPSRPPLFQVLFNFHTPPPGKIGLAGLSWVPFEIDTRASQFDICVTIDPEITRKIWVAYNTDLYDAATIARMLNHYQRLLEELVTDPDQPIGKLSILTDSERRQLLVEWNDNRAVYPQSCVHELFEAQVRQTPDAVAVVFEDQHLTYRDLNQRANQVAHRLRAMGVNPEVLVGICMDRSPELLAGLLGILKAGGAYVPIDPAYPQERIAFMVEDSGMHLLLTQERLLKTLPQNGNRVIPLESLGEEAELENREDPVSLTRPQNLAYVIYTSGSTGKPKGVEVEHKALVNFLHSMRQKPGMSNQDILLSVTTVSFDIAALELFLPLTVGAQVVLVSREVAADGRWLREQLENARATVMQATPATWRMLLEAGWKGAPGFKILCGGETVSPELAKALVQRSGVVWNLYGPTETTVWSTAWQVDASFGRISIGRPIANTQVYVLDSNLEPVPMGMPGELYLGGDGLARGYLRRPELTVEKFIPNPYSHNPEARLYKTGDLARYLPDGNVELIGRKDYQVKIRGFRVEPGEIEALLSQHPSVQQAIVLTREDSPGDKRLVAYVLPRREQTPAASDLRNFLKSKLPQYMIPSAIVMLESLPLSPNGKVDRKALPVPDEIRSESENGFVAPRDPVELQLTKIWERLLGSQPIGVKDNFFDLGGHSLLAVRLIAQIEKAFGKNLPLATLFQAPTIEQLASALRCQESSPPWSRLVPFQTGGSKPPFFCLHGGGKKLAKLLGTDQPLYGLQPHGQDGRRAPSKIEDMAADYIKEIRTIQPKGPYYLGGYSFGGMVVFEVAQQLQKQGQEIALLVLLDPTKPVYRRVSSLVIPSFPEPLSNITLLRDEVHQHLGNLALLGFQERLAYLWERVGWRIEGIKKELKMIACRFYLAVGRRVPFNLRMFYFFEISHQAARKYTPQVYTGSMILFRTQRPSYDPRFDWPRLAAGGLEIHELPGKHLEILKEPYVEVLAEHLKKYLD